MAIKLIIESLGGRLNTVNLDLDQSLITFGRNKSCHIELHHSLVSRHHFIIKFVDNAYIMMDEGSRHGTMLDGQKLVPLETVVLGMQHQINVPGFLIKLWWDGQKPRLERTTVVARKLLDELLKTQVNFPDCPSLVGKNSAHDFKFHDSKSSFVLGSQPQVDFVINDELVAKKHVSFARDINGIRLIPVKGYEVFVDGIKVIEPQWLLPGSVIKVGNTELIFSKQSDEESKPLIVVKELEIIPEQKPAFALIEELHEAKIPFDKRILKAMDRLFLCAFIVAMVATSVLLLDLV